MCNKICIWFVVMTAVTRCCEGRSASVLTHINPLYEFALRIKPYGKWILMEKDGLLIKNIASNFYPKVLNQTNPTSEKNDSECWSSMIELGVDFLSGAPYAKRVFDSDGKIESGLLKGNIRWNGRYSECLEAKPDASPFNTKWCFLNAGQQDMAVQLNAEASLSTGICVPDTCTEAVLNKAIKSLSHFKNITLSIHCPLQPNLWTTADVLSVVVLSILIVLMIVGTAVDYFINENAVIVEEHRNTHEDDVRHTFKSTVTVWRKLSDSFSIIKNTNILFNVERKQGTIDCLHGMRFFSMAWVVLGHTYVTSLVYVDNVLDMTSNLLNAISFQTVANANFSVDTFFFLSGLLVAYLSLKPDRFTWKRIPMFYLQRYIRITPTYAFLILCTVGFIGKLGDGPRWPEAYKEMHDSCQNYWWTNLLFINNLHPSALLDECYALGWYLANDMQFFLLAPISLLLLKWQPKLGLGLLISGLYSSMVVTGTISSYFKIQPSPIAIAIALGSVSHHGFGDGPMPANSSHLGFQPVPPQDAFWADTYAKPWCRIGVYLVGMITGYFLQAFKTRIYFTKLTAVAGTAVAVAINMSLVYGLWWHVHNSTILNIDTAAFYEAICRPLWAITLAWIVVLCASGHGGPMNAFLSWKIFIPLSRLTFCTYLIHPLVTIFWYGTQEVDIHYSDTQFAFFFLAILVSSLAAAYILSMLIEMPFINLGRALMEKSSREDNRAPRLLINSENIS